MNEPDPRTHTNVRLRLAAPALGSADVEDRVGRDERAAMALVTV
jgi:hypothetical protein